MNMYFKCINKSKVILILAVQMCRHFKFECPKENLN